MKINFNRNINLTTEENESLRRAYQTSEYFNMVTTIPTTDTLKKGEVKFYNDGTDLWIYTSNGTNVKSQKLGVTEGLVGSYTVDNTGISDGMVMYYDSASGTIKFKTISITPTFSAGSVIMMAADTERAISSGSYIIKKSIQVSASGTVTVVFGLKSQGSGDTAYGKIYVNGSPVGTERSTTSAAGEGFTENITVAAGDYVQLYCKDSSGGYCYNFEILVDSAPMARVITD